MVDLASLFESEGTATPRALGPVSHSRAATSPFGASSAGSYPVDDEDWLGSPFCVEAFTAC
jgi:hypothetical protein